MKLMKKVALASLILGLVVSLSGCGGETEEVVLTAKQEQLVAERLAPEGTVVLEGEVVSAAPVTAVIASGEPRSGEDIYNKSCMSCHMTGAAGAPKLGDSVAWADRIAQGSDTLYTNAISGIRGMPPRGLCMDCSDEELQGTVDYLIENSQ